MKIVRANECHSEGGAAPDQLVPESLAPTEESTDGVLVGPSARPRPSVTTPPGPHNLQSGCKTGLKIRQIGTA
jgi:hypothetical protein